MSRDGASLNQYRSSCDSAGVAAAPPSRGCPVLMVPARTALESSGIGLKTICPVHQWTNLLAMFASTDCRATASKGMRELRCHLFALPSSPCNLAVWPVVFLWCLKRQLTHFPRHPPRRFDLFFFESSPLSSRCYVYLDECDEARPRRRFGVSKARSCAKRRGLGKVEARGPGNATMDSISTVHIAATPPVSRHRFVSPSAEGVEGERGTLEHKHAQDSVVFEGTTSASTATLLSSQNVAPGR